VQQPSTQQVQLSAIERVAIEDSRTDSYLRTAFLTVIVLVGGLGGWAAMTEISGAVVATGKVAVEANSKAVQHLDGGIIREIAIKEGETVDEGQVLLRLDAGQADDSIRGLESQQRASKAQLELLKAELDDLEKLAVKRLVPRSQLAKARRDYAELEGELGRLTAELQRMGTSRQRLEVRAPIAGRVHALQVHTLGGVIKPGQELLHIVPSDAKLIIEARVNPADIDQVALNQPVSITLSSFNQRSTPQLNGKVTNVSADLVASERQDAHYYAVQITFDEGELARLDGRECRPTSSSRPTSAPSSTTSCGR
jgi:multidrug efflux pump subunit AcrA (membrane-fusion protein)